MTDTVRLLRLKQVLNLIPLGRSTIYDWMARDTFPMSINLGGGIFAWRESEVLAWIAERPVSARVDSSGVIFEGIIKREIQKNVELPIFN